MHSLVKGTDELGFGMAGKRLERGWRVFDWGFSVVVIVFGESIVHSL